MIYNFDEFNNIITKLGVSPNQMYICMMMLEKDFKKKIELLNKYIKQEGGFDFSDIEFLISKGYVEDFNTQNFPVTLINEKGRKILIKDKEKKLFELYMVTPKFQEDIFIDNYEAAKEAYEIFPRVLYINGVMQSARTIGYEEFEIEYPKIINGNGVLHKRIIQAFSNYKRLIKAKKVHGMGLRNALKQRYWEVIEEMIELDNEENEAKFTKQR